MSEIGPWLEHSQWVVVPRIVMLKDEWAFTFNHLIHICTLIGIWTSFRIERTSLHWLLSPVCQHLSSGCLNSNDIQKWICKVLNQNFNYPINLLINHFLNVFNEIGVTCNLNDCPWLLSIFLSFFLTFFFWMGHFAGTQTQRTQQLFEINEKEPN